MTATLPLKATARLLEKVNFLPSATQLIRVPTLRPDIIYERFKLTGKRSSSMRQVGYYGQDGQILNMVDFINRILSQFDHRHRALVCCLTKKDAEFIAGVLDCDYYHADLATDKAKAWLTLDNWTSGEKCSLAATSCLSAGYDYGFIGLVAHYGKPRNLIDKEQESGRAARDIPYGYAATFYDPDQRDMALQDGQDDIGVAEINAWVAGMQCYRIIPGESLDGDGRSCLEHRTVSLCGWCSAKVRSSNMVRIHIVLSTTRKN